MQSIDKAKILNVPTTFLEPETLNLQGSWHSFLASRDTMILTFFQPIPTKKDVTKTNQKRWSSNDSKCKYKMIIKQSTFIPIHDLIGN